MSPQSALVRVSDGRDLSSAEMLSIMRQIMAGEVSSVMIAAFISSLRTKGETVDEIAAAAKVMREFATSVEAGDDSKLLDTCGTGGDGARTFNISTVSAFVAAAAGVKVAKHGGRSVSSNSGSADLLESFGANIMLSSAQVGQCVERVGIGFMFAPNHHSAMKYAGPVRKELGMRTIFNILGPLTNPAGANCQLLGVFRKELVSVLARVLKLLGSETALVVHGEDGLDELSISSPTHIAELKLGEIKEYTIVPEEFGIKKIDGSLLTADSIETSKTICEEVFAGKGGPQHDIISLNAGAGIYVAGMAKDIKEGVERARDVISSGLAKQKLDEFITFTNQC